MAEATLADLFPEHEALILEVEPFPELTPTALVPRLAAEAGIAFPDLIERILDGARLHAGRRLRERRDAVLPVTGSDRRAGGVAESH